MPRLTCTASRAPSVAKLDHSARTRPSLPMITPSKSDGGFTSETTSRLASRNCSVRDSGNVTSSIVATFVASERRRESPAEADDRHRLARLEFARVELDRADGRAVERLRVERDDRQVVQRVHVFDLAGHFDRAADRDAHVAWRDRHRVAIDDDEAALGVDDDAGAVVVALGDAGQRERHVERHQHERRGELVGTLVGADGEIGAGGLDRCRSRGRRQFYARPQASLIVATADPGREPGAVHPHHARLGALRVVERRVAQGRALAVRQRGDDVAELAPSWSTGLPFTLEITAPRGTPAAFST